MDGIKWRFTKKQLPGPIIHSHSRARWWRHMIDAVLPIRWACPGTPAPPPTGPPQTGQSDSHPEERTDGIFFKRPTLQSEPSSRLGQREKLRVQPPLVKRTGSVSSPLTRLQHDTAAGYACNLGCRLEKLNRVNNTLIIGSWHFHHKIKAIFLTFQKVQLKFAFVVD